MEFNSRRIFQKEIAERNRRTLPTDYKNRLNNFYENNGKEKLENNTNHY